MLCISRLAVESSAIRLIGARYASTPMKAREVYKLLDKENYRYSIPAIKREKDGRTASRQYRSNGAIPGVLYGSDGKGNDSRVLIAVPASEVSRFVNKYRLSFESTLFDLDLEGEKILCFPRDLSCHPLTELPENLNFIRMDKAKGTYAQIPVRYYNHEKNGELKKGGFLSTATRYLDVLVKGDVSYVPPFINCNLESLTHKSFYGVEHLDFDRTKFIPHPNMKNKVFASISGKVSDFFVEDAPAADAAATTTATTTTTTAPATSSA